MAAANLDHGDREPGRDQHRHGERSAASRVTDPDARQRADQHPSPSPRPPAPSRLRQLRAYASSCRHQWHGGVSWHLERRGSPISAERLRAASSTACRPAATRSAIGADHLPRGQQRQCAGHGGPARRGAGRPPADMPTAASRPASRSPMPSRQTLIADIGVRVQSTRSSAAAISRSVADTAPRKIRARQDRRQPRRGGGAPDPVPAEPTRRRPRCCRWRRRCLTRFCRSVAAEAAFTAAPATRI